MGVIPDNEIIQQPIDGEPAHIQGRAEYEELYRLSIERTDTFWSDQACRYLTWEREWDFVLRYDSDEAVIAWFAGGIINASVNCLDRHLAERGDVVAFHWQGEASGESRSVTYSELFESVCGLAGFLRHRGVGRGDTVFIYASACLEVPTAMLACARIGAVHCVVSPAYGRAILAERMKRCRAKALIAADGYYRSGKPIPLDERIAEAARLSPDLEFTVVVNRLGTPINTRQHRVVKWSEALAYRSKRPESQPEPMDAEASLFIMFASGAIGKPNPLVHTHGGYLLWAAMTSRLILNLQGDDVVWISGDPSWINSHTFGVYGTLLNGATGILYEGTADCPGPSRFSEIISAYRVTKLSLSSHDIRVLAANEREIPVNRESPTLKLISVDERMLTRDQWRWCHDFLGEGRCPVIPMWGQEETGGPALALLPGIGQVKLGCASKPFFGISPITLDLDTGEATRFPNQEGAFFIKGPWPGMARSVLHDHSAFREEYFGPFSGLFITGEGAARDEEGDYWMKGRIDDVIYTAGWRIGCWEVESALVSHPSVAEATVVGYPHALKGQGLYAFVTLQGANTGSDDLRRDLSGWLETRIGSMVVPDFIQWADDLPKTRSGKILRRLLQRIAEGKVDDLGDLTTVANPEVLDRLIKERVSVS